MKKNVILILAVLALCMPGRAQNEAGTLSAPSAEGLFPFLLSYDMAKGVTDFSFLLDAPAGKHGFTRIENGHFVNDAGRIRFNGINFVGGANFPSHEQSDRLAKRLAHFGVNCVRLHYFDGDYIYRDFHEKGILEEDGVTFAPEQQDKFDYLVSALKKEGVYVNVNLMVARPFKERNGFDKEIQQKEIDYFRALFAHVNPYTGLTLADDPAVCIVELNNENAMMSTYMGRKEPWSVEAGEPDWPTYAELKNAPESKKLEMLRTIEELDRVHWERQKDILVNEIGIKVPITSTQVSYTTPWAVMGMDFFDMHAYWCHPNDSRITDKWTIHNLPMVNADNLGRLSALCCYRPVDRPFTVSEYNHPFPCFYGAEGQPMIHAYAAFQDWDGVTAHSYCNLHDMEPQCLTYNFNTAARTDALAHYLCCASMLVRGDVDKGESVIVQNLPRDYYEKEWTKRLDRLVYDMLLRASDGTVTRGSRLIHRVATDFNATETKVYPKEELGPVKVSEGGQIEWNRDISNQGMFIVRTGNTKVFTGFPAGRTIDWGDGISFEVGQTKLGWTTMSLVSKKGNGFARKADALLVATGFTQHTGQVFHDVSGVDNGVGQPRLIHCRYDAWGTAPVLTEGIPATVKLASKARRTRCWALDERGKRMKKVPVTRADDGTAVIAIGPEYKTVWYEIKTR